MKGEDGPKKDLSMEIAGIHFDNPLLLASGVADETGMSMAMAVKNGAGGVVTKSLSLDARDGHPNPCVVDLPYGMLNAMGLPNPGIQDYMKEIRTYLTRTENRAPIIASIFGSTIEEYGEAASILSDSGVHAIEINGSCPNASGLGLQFGQDPDVIRDLVSHLKSKTPLPVFFKLTPNTDNITRLAKAATEAGADALVAINTVQAMKIDIHTRRPILTNITGGLSGPAIKPIGVRCVHAIATEMDTPVIAVGGATTWEDVIEYILAGASAVQVGTAVTWHNLGVFSDMKRGLIRYLEDQGLEDLRHLVGASLEVGE